MSQDRINLPVRRICRIGALHTNHMYQVYVQDENGTWSPESKEYPHSTSAFAAMGRLYQKDVIAVIGEEELPEVE